MIENTDRREPLQHGANVAERIAADSEFDVVRIDEIEPQTVTDEYETSAIGWCGDESGHVTFAERMVRDYP
jgi:hypothetical protein